MTTVLNIDAMARVLIRHQYMVPDDSGKPTEDLIKCGGGSGYGCGYPLGSMRGNPWAALARHQAWELTHRSDVVVVTEKEGG
jgi:hypothetical protein